MHQAALFSSYLTCGFIPGNFLRRKGEKGDVYGPIVSIHFYIYIFFTKI